MSDLLASWSNDRGAADLVQDGPDLVADEGLETAVLISYFTDKRAPEGIALPDGTDDRRGWWGDAFPEVAGDEIGSLFWMLDRATLTTDTLRQLEDFARDALAWMVADRVAKTITVTASRIDISQALLVSVITRPDGRQSRFSHIWDANS